MLHLFGSFLFCLFQCVLIFLDRDIFLEFARDIFNELVVTSFQCVVIFLCRYIFNEFLDFRVCGDTEIKDCDTKYIRIFIRNQIAGRPVVRRPGGAGRERRNYDRSTTTNTTMLITT